MIEFSIPGAPVPKGRPRHTMKGITYTPSKTREAEADFISLARVHAPDGPPPEHPVRLNVIFYFPIPKSKPMWMKHIMGGDCWQHISRPDVDNLLKMCMDSMTRLGFWKDDSFVYSITTEKYYSSTPRTDVEVTYDPIMTRKGLIHFSGPA